MTEPCDLPASEARRMIGAGELSPVELTLSCLRRIDDLNPTLNAMVALATDRALEEAELAAKAVVHRDSLGLLHGLPVAIKDL